MKTLLIGVLLLSLFTSCKKEEINHIPSNPSVCIVDTTQGNYHVISVTYGDSLGEETTYITNVTDLIISENVISVFQSSILMEELSYNVIATGDSIRYYLINSNLEFPCNNHKLELTSTGTYLLQLPTNSTGCYRVFKMYKQ